MIEQKVMEKITNTHPQLLQLGMHASLYSHGNIQDHLLMMNFDVYFNLCYSCSFVLQVLIF